MPSETTGVIADRYATALFDLADGQSVLDQVAGDLKSLKAMIRDSADLNRLLDSPALKRAEQGKAVAALAVAAQFHGLTTNFLGLVASHRRLNSLPAMIRAFLGLLAKKRGEVSAQVTSAAQLSQSQFDALVASLKSACGGNVAVDVAVDPSLLGGMVVKVGSRMVDSSLKTKLQHLKLAMKGVG
ncbi:MAG: ATP synthase subunit [Rhodospirillaceae bacterium]|nr:MAG: ATP synthase subunit [Rhodospirillaceae bacterium]TNC96483.1 MAG: ATP synthase subunit delta [Stygiobacter sp.]